MPRLPLLKGQEKNNDRLPSRVQVLDAPCLRKGVCQYFFLGLSVGEGLGTCVSWQQVEQHAGNDHNGSYL